MKIEDVVNEIPLGGSKCIVHEKKEVSVEAGENELGGKGSE